MVIGVIRLAANPQSISQSEAFFTGNVMFRYLQHLSLVKRSFRRFADVTVDTATAEFQRTTR